MPLTPEEEAELAELNDRLGPPTETSRGTLTDSPFLGGVAKGATMATADEMAAMVRASQDVTEGRARSFEEAYSANLAAIRGESRAREEASPFGSAAGEMAGSLAVGVPAAVGIDRLAARLPRMGRFGRIAAAPLRLLSGNTNAQSWLGRRARNVASGATAGALSGAGFGYGEGEGEDRPSKAMEAAGYGGGAGAVLGPVAPLVVGTGRAVGAGVRNMASPAARAQVEREAALRELMAVLERDDTTTRSIRNQAATTDKPLAIVDMAGENAQSRAQMAGKMPGASRNTVADFVNERFADQTDRLTADFSKYVSGGDPKATLKSLSDLKETAAAPAYKVAYAAVPQMKSPRLNQLFDILEEVQGDIGGSVLDYAGTLAKIGEKGAPIIKQNATGKNFYTVSTENIDYIDRALRDKIEKYGLKENTFGQIKYNALGKEMSRLRNELRDEMFRINPDLRTARETFAGIARSEEALENGSRLFKFNSDDLDDIIGNMTPAEKDFFRVGVVKAMQERIASGNDGQDAVKKFFAQRRNKSALEKAFDSKSDWKAFERAMDTEADMARVASRIRPSAGSPTMPLNTEADFGKREAGEALFDAGRSAIVGDAPGMVHALANSVMNAFRRQSKGYSEEQMDAIARLLTDTDQGRINASMRGIDDIRSRTNRQLRQEAEAVPSIAFPLGEEAGETTRDEPDLLP